MKPSSRYLLVVLNLAMGCTLATAHPAAADDLPIQPLSPIQGAPDVTALSGQVLSTKGKTLEGVTLQIHDQTTQTDKHGRFLLVLPDPLDSGTQELLIDGRTTGKHNKNYGLFEARVEVRAGHTTVLPFTIWLPEIDAAHAVAIPSPTTTEVVVTTPRIPGLELHIPPGTVIRDHDGQVVTHVSLTAIPVDRPPFPLPANVQVPIYFTLQPGGAYLTNAHHDGRGLSIPTTPTSSPTREPISGSMIPKRRDGSSTARARSPQTANRSPRIPE